MLQFRLLGQFEVCSNSTPLTLPSRPAQSLLAYLLLHRTVTHRREKLAGLIWPDASETNARRSLRQELWRLRKALDSTDSPRTDLFLCDDLSVTIDSQAAYYLDVALLETPLPAAPAADDLILALAVYHGELLPDFYDEWVAPERERLCARFEQLAGQLLERLCAEQRWMDVLEWAERWITLVRSPEPAFRALMVAHAALGNRAQVAAVFKRCAAALQEDLGVEPSEQTRALCDHLLHSAEATRAPTLAPPSLPTFIVAEETPLKSAAPPYKGLHYFDEADAEWFFGREQLVKTLVSHLNEHQLLTVVGASGSGKSSLVRAGLIPALKAAPPDGRGDWLVHVMTPTAHPLDALAVSLTHTAPSLLATTALTDELARDPRALRVYCQRMVPEENHLLLVIDQFEELFTLCRDEQERRAFIDNLLIATAPELDQPLHVVVALRADFYVHCAQYANLREALARRQEYIGPMSAQELLRAIEGPALRARCELEPGLAELMLRDVANPLGSQEPGALPLLSHALLETWKRRQGRVLTLEGYASSGGVRGAIAQTAEAVFHQLPPAKQEITRRIFLQLTELGEGTQDTRRRVTLAELNSPTATPDAVREVLNELAQARLVTLGEDSAEVAHEALIREWPALREWLNQNREGLRVHRQLSEAAESWEKLGRDPGALYRGVRLAQAQEWMTEHAPELNAPESQFLAASQEEQAREAAEHEAQRRRELEAVHKLAEEERKRAQAESQRAEAERGRAEAEMQRAQTERGRAEEQARANHKLRRHALYLGGALLVAGLLAIVALALAQHANQNAARAENERRIAFVRELSVNAVNNLEQDPERSILLALQAASASSTGGQPVLREAEEALHRAVQSSRLQLTLRGHSAGLWNIVFSPDGKRLATAGIDKTAKVWDAVTGQLLLTLNGHTKEVPSIAYSPDGRLLATASCDYTAKVWDAITGQELLTLRGHSDFVYGVAFSPDGKRLATASFDKTAKVWELATGQELLTLTGNAGGLSRIVFSPDGKRLAAGSWSDDAEHPVKVWDAVTGQLLLTLKGHANLIWDLAFSPDGERLATGSSDVTAKIWDSATGQLLLTLFPKSAAMGVAFSPDGSRLATGSSDGKARVWDAATGQLLQTLAGHAGLIYGVTFSPEGTRLATASGDTTARIWDTTPAGSREWLTLEAHQPVALHAAYSPDGTRLATAGGDNSAKIWDVETGGLLFTLSGHTGHVEKLTFSQDGRRLATTSLDQTVRVWDAETGKPLLNLPAGSFPAPIDPQVAFSPDGKRIASASTGYTAKVWDAATGEELLNLSGHISYVRSTVFSPDGTRLLTGSVDGAIKIWDAFTGKELHTLSGHTSLVYVIIYSPDGRRIATVSGDGTAKLWDAATNQLLLTFVGHTGTVYDVAFSPDGARLATASADGSAKVWNISTVGGSSDQPLTLYNPNAIAITGVSFSPDGARLAVSANDGTVRIYALTLDDLITIAKSRVTRRLTADECVKFLHMEQCPP